MDQYTWAGAAHWGKILGNLIGIGILVPLLILLMKGKEDPLISAHAKASLNAEISYLIYLLISAVLILILIGFVAMGILAILWLLGVIMNSLKASRGEYPSQYYLAISFLK